MILSNTSARYDKWFMLTEHVDVLPAVNIMFGQIKLQKSKSRLRRHMYACSLTSLGSGVRDPLTM